MSELMRLSKSRSCPTAVVVQGQEAAWFPHKGTHQTHRPVHTHLHTHTHTDNRSNARLASITQSTVNKYTPRQTGHS